MNMYKYIRTGICASPRIKTVGMIVYILTNEKTYFNPIYLITASDF